MDELTIEDKKYISTKRAAKITGYAKDYIGQLCREGRVPARLVGRSWYALESALQDHRFGSETAPAYSGTEKPSADAASTLPDTWSARYESVASEELPTVNRLNSPRQEPIAVNDFHDEDSGKEAARESTLYGAWEEWFSEQTKRASRVSAAEEGTASGENEQNTPEETPEPIVPVEAAVPVTVHAIYHERYTPEIRHAPNMPIAAPERRENPMTNTNLRMHSRTDRSRFARAISIGSILIAIAAAGIASIGSGYLDSYVASAPAVGLVAGVSLYNK